MKGHGSLESEVAECEQLKKLAVGKNTLALGNEKTSLGSQTGVPLASHSVDKNRVFLELVRRLGAAWPLPDAILSSLLATLDALERQETGGPLENPASSPPPRN